ICLRNAHVLQRDLAVLDDFQRDLVLHLLDAETGGRFVLDDESLDLIVSQIPRPDDRKVAPWRVADPPLLAIEDPAIPFALAGRGQATARSRTDQRLRQPATPDLF